VLEPLGGLGVDGLRAVGHRSVARWVGERAWAAMPRLGSQRSEVTRRAGLLAARAASLPDVSPSVFVQAAQDRATGFARHAQAKATVRRTLPAMLKLLEGIP